MKHDLKKRKYLLYGLWGLVAVFLVLYLFAAEPIRQVFLWPTIIVVAVYVAAWAILWKCPHCRAHLGRMDEKAAYCKYCGGKLK